MNDKPFEEQISILHGIFFLVRDGVQYQDFLLVTQELIHFTQEILPLLPKKLRTPYSRNLRVPSQNTFQAIRCARKRYRAMYIRSSMQEQLSPS